MQLKYTEYSVLGAINSHIILFNDVVDTISVINKNIYDLMIMGTIKEYTRIFYLYEGSENINNKENVKHINKNIYEHLFYSGNSQHYMQINFMKHFLKTGEQYENNITRYLNTTTVLNKQIVITQRSKLEGIGQKSNYFSPQSNCYLDQFISAIELKCNQILREINNDYNYILKEDNIKNIFQNLCYISFLKSSYNINKFDDNIKKSYQRCLSAKAFNSKKYREEFKELKKIIINEQSSTYYSLLNKYILEEYNNIGNNFKYSKVVVRQIENLPLSENTLFYFDFEASKFQIGYNQNSDHSIFTLDENHVVIFYTKNCDNLFEYIDNDLIDFILSNSHDFLITKTQQNIQKLTEKKYSDIDYSQDIKNVWKFLINGKTNIKYDLSLYALMDKILNKDKSMNLYQEKNFLADIAVDLENKLLYISKEDFSLLNNNDIYHIKDSYYKFINNKFIFYSKQESLQIKTDPITGRRVCKAPISKKIINVLYNITDTHHIILTPNIEPTGKPLLLKMPKIHGGLISHYFNENDYNYLKKHFANICCEIHDIENTYIYTLEDVGLSSIKITSYNNGEIFFTVKALITAKIE